MAEYKHGLYGGIQSSTEEITKSNNIAVYVGTLPMFRVEESKRTVNKPILIRNSTEAITKTGYLESDDFNTFTLNAAIFAHFFNSIEPIGPIVLINVLDPTNATSKTVTLDFANKKVILDDDNVDIETVEITGKTIDVDYNLEYNTSGKLVITSEFTDELDVTYKVVDTTILPTDIVGTYNTSTETRTGIKAIEDIYEELNVIPSLILAPGYSQIPIVRQALISATSKISERWEAIAFEDLESDSVTNIEDVIEWKENNNYSSNSEKVFWPRAIMAGKEIYLSVIAAVCKMQTDLKYNEIPYQSISNKEIDISGLVVGNGSSKKSIKFSMERANKLNANGITTSIYNGGKRVLWGPHMANYKYNVTSKPEEIFDVNIIMEKYLLNQFMLRNTDVIDKTMTRHDIDSLLTSEQMILDSYVSAGQLMYGSIEFVNSENTKADIIEGNFKFHSLVTNTPIAKSLTNVVQYTSKGLDDAYEDTDEGEGEE